MKEYTIDELRKCHGRRFKAKIEGQDSKGRITVEGGHVYLCQDERNGVDADNKLGYKYSWSVTDGLKANAVTDFCMVPITPAEIEGYKDWRVGDKLQNAQHMESGIREVIFRSGELVVLKYSFGSAGANYTCDELYNKGWRLVPEKDEASEEIIEVTIDEIAKMKGVDASCIRVKKED